MANNLPVVTLNDGIPTTLSTDVAATFGKQHKDVLVLSKTSSSITPKTVGAILRFALKTTL